MGESRSVVLVERIKNGWIVTDYDEWSKPQQAVFAATWEEVAALCKNAAHWMSGDPKGPR